MPKIDAYLRSIERFGATGALLSSGQSITLRFPSGDRHATQVTPHELLVAMIREIAPAAAWASLDGGRPARFELDSGGNRFGVAATPSPNAWHVAIEVLTGGAKGDDGLVTSPTTSVVTAMVTPVATPPPVARGREPRFDELAASLAIERTPYDDGPTAAPGGSGSALLDQLLAWARGKKASDLMLAAGTPAAMRLDGRWQLAEDHPPIDGELLSRELGVLAPAAARAAWFERGEACFGAADATGRLRVHLGRDAGGPRAAIRLLLGEPPPLERLHLPELPRRWIKARRGLIVVTGGPGSGKSTTWASLVRELAAAPSPPSIAVIEEPIELLQRTSSLLSQREAPTHIPTVAAGVRAAMRDGAEVIAVGRAQAPETAEAIACAVEAGHLVLVVVDAASTSAALGRLGEAGGLPGGRDVIAEGLLGVVAQELLPRADGAGRLAAFEVVPGGPELAQLVRERRWERLPELLARERASGAQSLRDAIAELTRRGHLGAPT
jgi:twitching motility protein PilT